MLCIRIYTPRGGSGFGVGLCQDKINATPPDTRHTHKCILTVTTYVAGQELPRSAALELNFFFQKKKKLNSRVLIKLESRNGARKIQTLLLLTYISS